MLLPTLETSITNEIEVMSDGDGTVAVPAKILLDTLKQPSPTNPITMAVDDENFGITITSAYGKYRLAGENGQDYPRIPEAEQVDSVKVPSSTLGQCHQQNTVRYQQRRTAPCYDGCVCLAWISTN